VEIGNKCWRSLRIRLKFYIAMSKSPPAFPQRRILVVDDEPFVCDAVKMMLNFDGHVVETASNGKDALAMLDKEKFDVVITDFAMPAMKGDELAATIKARTPEQPVVMITAYAEMLKSSGNPLKGVDFVISKPFLLENLREAISKVTPAQPRKKDGAGK
jgi:CheY-like chemotaxis protein